MSRAGKTLLFGACLALGFFQPQGEVERGPIEAAARPNIVFILTDDLDVASVSMEALCRVVCSREKRKC